MPRAPILFALALVLSACGTSERHASGEHARQAGPIVKTRPDARFLDRYIDEDFFTYEQAKLGGLPVGPVPQADEICAPAHEDGFASEEEELEIPDLDSETGPTCTVDPRTGWYKLTSVRRPER